MQEIHRYVYAARQDPLYRFLNYTFAAISVGLVSRSVYKLYSLERIAEVRLKELAEEMIRVAAHYEKVIKLPLQADTLVSMAESMKNQMTLLSGRVSILNNRSFNLSYIHLLALTVSLALAYFFWKRIINDFIDREDEFWGRRQLRG